jgi:hypothetical protein
VGVPGFVDEVDGQHGVRPGRDAVRVAGGRVDLDALERLAQGAAQVANRSAGLSLSSLNRSPSTHNPSRVRSRTRVRSSRSSPSAAHPGLKGAKQREQHLVIDWATVGGGLHLFCAVLAWSRWRFLAFATDEKATTTLALIAAPSPAVSASAAMPKLRPASRHHGPPRVRTRVTR